MAEARHVLFTVGHGTRPFEELLDLLRDAHVELLVDVRTAPGSRRNPRFARAELETALPRAGVAYDWREDLGGFRRPAPDSPNVAIRNASFRGYADHMATPTFAAALGALEREARAQTTAIMCAESLWWRCHRRMIADALTVAGWEVVHLLQGGRREPHRLHPSLRVEDGRLIYDVGEQAPLL